MAKNPPHPIQPLIRDEDGRTRFKINQIVRDLLDFAQPKGFGHNEIAMRNYSREDYAQFIQLIGYTLDGAYELNLPVGLLETAEAIFDLEGDDVDS